MNRKVAPSYEYAVITKVPDATAGDTGNLATALDNYIETEQPDASNEYRGRIAPAIQVLGFGVALALRSPVFVLGEVLILNADGREVTGRGRKPGKWSVETEEFATVEEAVARSLEIEAAP